MPPIKPWLLKPKQSLRIFEGLEELLDKRQQRQDAAEAKQQRIEDRVFGSLRQARQDQLNEQLLEARIANLNKPPSPHLTKITGPDGTVQFVDPSKPPPGLRERVPGRTEAAETDAMRLNRRIKELTATGMSLSAANTQARQEFGYAAPRTPRQADAQRHNEAEVRSAERDAATSQREYRGVLARRPRQSQYTDPLTRMADTTAFNEAETNWRADSTDAAGSLADAQAYLESVRPRRPSPSAGGGGRAGGGRPVPQAKKPVSDTDRGKAALDPAFAQWLRDNGYDIDSPRPRSGRPPR